MLASRRVHPVNHDKPTHDIPAGRREAYQVDKGIEDDVVVTNGAAEVDFVGKKSDVLSKRFVLGLMTFVCLLSIITFVLTVAVISGKIEVRCSCSDATENQQKQGTVSFPYG